MIPLIYKNIPKSSKNWKFAKISKLKFFFKKMCNKFYFTLDVLRFMYVFARTFEPCLKTLISCLFK